MGTARMLKIALAALVGGVMLAAPASAGAGQWDYLLAPESACPNQSTMALSAGTQARTMVCMHNYARAQAGVPGLHFSRELRASSTKKARDIRRCQQFSHEACGRNPFYWVQRVGFERGSWGAGENLALGTGADGSVRNLMSAWLNSDLHRTVLLDPRFDQVGISDISGRYHSAGAAKIWVAHFGYH